MKALALFLALSFSTLGLWAQTTPQTPPPPPPPPMHHPMMGMHHPMMDMEGQAAKMRATLEKMKANLGKIADPALKQQAQYDVDLWEAMVQHMEGMSKMMKAHDGMGMGMEGMHHPMPPSNDQAPAPAPVPEKK